MGHDLTTEFRNMAIALFMGYKALLINETPVSCIFVSNVDGTVLSIGFNDTNNSLNGTRHAEFVAIDQILDKYIPLDKRGDIAYVKDFFLNVTLYVTVEPCIMCASALRQIGIDKVVFGCGNDRFGGNGTVLSIHSDKSIDKPYNSYGGILRTEGIQLLRNFYIQENQSAPQPQKKKNKEIEAKEYPLNMKFKSYLANEAFLLFYGEGRSDFYESSSDKEITPVIGKGYLVRDLICVEDLVHIPDLKKVYSCRSTESTAKYRQLITQDLEYFYSLFHDIADDGKVVYESKVLNIDEIVLQKLDMLHKKRKIN